MVNYPAKLNLAQTPTPFHPLDRLSEALCSETRIWIKRDDLTGCLTTGNKVRKLEFLLAEALASDCDTLITSGGTQSNHCRAVAILGAQLGLKVHLLLRADSEPLPIGNLLLDQLAGATITHYSKEAFRQLDKLFRDSEEQYRLQGRTPFSIPTGGSSSTGVWGYIAAAEELKRDFDRENISPGAIVHATGSGGTQAGLIAGTRLHEVNIPVISYAVCDNKAYFSRKVRSDLEQWKKKYQVEIDLTTLNINTNDQYIGPGYGIATDDVFDTIKQLAALEGIVLDPVYSGKAFYGLIEDIKSGLYKNCSDIVFVHTGGIFGLLAQNENIKFQ